MKRILSSILLVMLSMLAVSAETERGKFFGIYLVTGEVDPRLKLGKGDWSKLPVLDEPIISEQEIESYDWEKHTLTLNSWTALSSIERVPVDGLPFIVIANGERIFLGMFTTPVSSMTFLVPNILMPFKPSRVLTNEPAYPNASFAINVDLRNDPRIKAALEAAGKLSRKVEPREKEKSMERLGDKHVELSTNEIVRVEKPGIGVGLVQFTELGNETAKYRWRFKPRAGKETSGTGSVSEIADQRNTSIVAGDLRLGWSYGGQQKTYVYSAPYREKVEVLSAEAFEKDF